MKEEEKKKKQCSWNSRTQMNKKWGFYIKQNVV